MKIDKLLNLLETAQTPVEFLKYAITVTDGDDEYFHGMRNGIRLALSVLTNEEPQYESLLKMYQDKEIINE